VKTVMVLFGNNGARVYINPPNAGDLAIKGALTNPDLSAVRRIPPHCWKLKGKKVVADSDRLKQYYIDIGMDVKTLSTYERVKAWISNLIA